MYTLKHWSVAYAGDIAYTPPELVEARLAGAVYGHPRFEDGERIVTSPIKTAEGRTITTKTGSVYLLEGDPAQGYADWLVEQGYSLNEDNPITI